MVAEKPFVGAGETRAGASRGRLVAERLSHDHKPESKGELERIQAAGGIVFPLPRRDASSGGGGGVAAAAFPPAAGGDQSLTTARDFRAGVPRVWAGGNGPGLAMSRSIGDKVRFMTILLPFYIILTLRHGRFLFVRVAVLVQYRTLRFSSFEQRPHSTCPGRCREQYPRAS